MRRLTSDDLENLRKRYAGDGEILALVHEVEERRAVDRMIIDQQPRSRRIGRQRGRR